MNETSELGGLYCDLHVPLEWEPLTASDSPVGVDLVNQNRLKIILGLDEVIHEADENPELGQELQRLDFKVNIILELVGQLVSHNLTLPPSSSIKLGPDTVQWVTREPAPSQGQTLEIRLYLDQRFPFPLSLRGQVAGLAQTPAGSQVQLVLDPMSEQTQDLLEKFIFRCHRRHIARMKTQPVNN